MVLVHRANMLQNCHTFAERELGQGIDIAKITKAHNAVLCIHMQFLNDGFLQNYRYHHRIQVFSTTYKHLEQTV